MSTEWEITKLDESKSKYSTNNLQKALEQIRRRKQTKQIKQTIKTLETLTYMMKEYK